MRSASSLPSSKKLNVGLAGSNTMNAAPFAERKNWRCIRPPARPKSHALIAHGGRDISRVLRSHLPRNLRRQTNPQSHPHPICSSLISIFLPTRRSLRPTTSWSTRRNPRRSGGRSPRWRRGAGWRRWRSCRSRQPAEAATRTTGGSSCSQRG